MCEKTALIDKILEKGQQLRSKLVQAIVNNDPFCFEACCVGDKQFSANQCESDKIRAYLKGDELSKRDEKLVLEVLRGLSSEELCKITDKTYAYKIETPQEVLYKSDTHPDLNLLKFVDSLKIVVKSFSLTDSGNKKINSNTFSNQTFFVEYEIPDLLKKRAHRNNFIRLCSRRFHEAINFKQTTVHDIKPLNVEGLNKLQIRFRVACRNLKEKIDLGFAVFDFENVAFTRNFTCNLELPTKIDSLIIVGHLKVLIQLGCGRLYFGKDFLNAIKDENVVILSDDSQEIETNKKDTVKKSFVKVETCKPVVLFGFVYISQAHFDSDEPSTTFISCQTFCQEDLSYSRQVHNDFHPVYNFCQQIPLIYNDKLLNRMRDNFMSIEFWMKCNSNKDVVFGLTKLPLHQFYVTFRNEILVKYLSEREHPIIGTDWWEPILSPINEEPLGQVQVLLALGTEQQINNLKRERGFSEQSVKSKLPQVKYNLKNKSPHKILKPKNVIEVKKVSVGVQNVSEIKKVNTGTQSDFIMAEKEVENNANNAVEEAQKDTNVELRKTSELVESLQQALAVDPRVAKKDKDFFKAQILINSALHLPCRKKCRSKKSKNRSRQDDVHPSTYVTFELDGVLKITPVVPKNSNPEWKFESLVNLPVSYLTDDQKKLIFKVWRKSTNTVMVPNMQADFVIGFAALDLTVLLVGLPNVQGWFNIVDFSGKTNGQINIHINPQDDLKEYQSRCCVTTDCVAIDDTEIIDESSELLGRTLKRKFTELDEITQRLRLRLSKVTADDSEHSDELADEFERDINTLCVEDDFDLIDFEQEAQKFSDNRQKAKEDRGLLQTDKNKIDSLLEKLSIISGDTGNLTSRYVSGCSTSHDEHITAETILNDLDHNSRPNIHSVLTFNNMMAQLYGHNSGSEDSPKQTD